MNSEDTSQSVFPPATPGDKESSSRERLRQGLTVVTLSLLFLMLSYLALRELTTILRPLLIAIFLCYLFVPAHHWLVRHKVPSLLAHLLIVGIVLVVSYNLAGMMFRSITEMSKDLPMYVQKLEDASDRVMNDLKNRLARLLPDHHPENAAGTATQTSLADEPVTATTGRYSRVHSHDEPKVAQPKFRVISPEQLIALGRSGVEAFVGWFTSALVVTVYMIFLLAESAGFERRVVNAFGSVRAARITAVTRKINSAVTQYIVVKTFVSMAIGLFTFAVLYAFDVQYALLWGILTFFANYIPYVGSMAAVTIPVLMCFIQRSTLGMPLTLLAILSIAHTLIGYYVEPRMIGKRLGVSPLMILLSLAFWGFLWDIPGMILATPLIVTLKIILENIESTRSIARMMSAN